MLSSYLFSNEAIYIFAKLLVLAAVLLLWLVARSYPVV